MLLSYGLLDTQIDKVRLLFELLKGVSDANINSDRVIGLLGVFDLITFSDLFFGLGLEFRGGHDFFSLMIVGIGISGVGVLFSYFASFYSKGNILLLTLLFFYSISNGSLLDPIYHAVFLYFILTYLERTDGRYYNYHGN